MTHSWRDDNVLTKEYNCLYYSRYSTCLFYESYEIQSLYINKKIIIWLGIPSISIFIGSHEAAYEVMEGHLYNDSSPKIINFPYENEINVSFVLCIKPLDTKTYAKLKLTF